MKRFIFIITILIIVVLTLTTQSCYPDKDIVEVIKKDSTFVSFQDTTWQDTVLLQKLPSTVKLPVETLDSLLKSLPLLKSIEGEKGGEIEIGDDLKLEFPENSCVGGASNSVIKGKIDVNFTVLRTRGELVLHNLPTVSGGRLLVSGGVINVKMLQNGNELRIADKKAIKIRYRMTNVDSKMQLFQGVISRFGFDWVLLNSSNTLGVFPWVDSTRETRGYEMILDRFGLINCDKFYEGNEKLTTNFCAAMPPSYTNVNTAVYVVFKDILSVVRLEGNAAKKAFCIPSGYKGLPIGKSVIVLSITSAKNKYFMDYKEATITEGGIVQMTPKELSLDEIRSKIKGL